MWTRELIRAAAVMTLCGGGMAAQRAASPSISTDREGDISLDLPVNAARLDRTVWRIARNTATQVGVELAPEPALGYRESPRTPPVESRLVFSGKSVSEAMDALVAAAPLYEWQRHGTILNIAPRAALRAGDFLDATVPAFGVAEISAPEALTRFRRLFDANAPQAPTGAMTSTLGAPGDDPAARSRSLAEVLGKRITVNVRNTTAREILNAICTSHGEMSWRVQYQGPLADFPHATVSLVAPDGSRIHW